jgi:hypothetical protein
MTTPTIARGGNRAAQAAAEEKAAKKNRGSWNNWEYLRLAAPPEGQTVGESAVIRLVDEETEWREVKQHSYIPTKPAPADKPDDKRWLAKFGAVCRYSVGLDDCYICDEMTVERNGKVGKPYAGTRLWTVAVLREEVLGTKEMFERGEIEEYEIGAPISYVDQTVEKDVFKDGKATGEKVTQKRFVVLNFAMDNFFDKLLGFSNTYRGTLLDRDYKITRTAGGTDTDYAIAPLDQIPMSVDDRGKTVWYDLRRPEIKAEYDYSKLFDLDQIIMDQASDEHYGWYFDPRVKTSWGERFGKKDDKKSDDKPETSEAAAATPEEAKAETDANSDTIAKMRARMKAAQSGNSTE